MVLKNITRANILGCQVDLVNMQEALEFIEQVIEQRARDIQVVTLNAEIIYQATQNEELRHVINQASLVTADGIGTVWAARTLGYSQKERVTGIDLLQNLCSRSALRGWKIYLLGAKPGVAEQAARVLEQTYPGLNVCGSRDGYFSPTEEKEIIKEIKTQKPHILFAALGAPKQEIWLSRNRSQLQVPVCMGVGGSFDVIAGVKRRAPDIFIKLNLEWLYRLLSEPARIRRQLVLPAFILKVLKQKYCQAGMNRNMLL